MNLGSAYSKIGRYDEACESYQKVLEMDPRHATALAFLGKTYILMGRLDDAILKFHEVRLRPFAFLPLNPENPID